MSSSLSVLISSFHVCICVVGLKMALKFLPLPSPCCADPGLLCIKSEGNFMVLVTVSAGIHLSGRQVERYADGEQGGGSFSSPGNLERASFG